MMKYIYRNLIRTKVELLQRWKIYKNGKFIKMENL